MIEQQLCRRCGEEISAADLLDAFPEIDRQTRSVAGEYLGPRLWRLFSYALLRQGLPMGAEEIGDYVFGRAATNHEIRNAVYELNRRLARTRFRIVTPRQGYRSILIADDPLRQNVA